MFKYFEILINFLEYYDQTTQIKILVLAGIILTMITLKLGLELDRKIPRFHRKKKKRRRYS